ncbi:MAG TPA: hypothetical protein VEI73_11440 [Candidatus Acidoferrum sp.]|nr:hypothetical protein [Candidatus Acidoferrum sp.]
MKTKILLLLAATILTAAAASAQSGAQYQGRSQAAPQYTPGPGYGGGAAPDTDSGVNPTPVLDDCDPFPQLEIPTDSSLPGPVDPGPAYVYATNDSPSADIIGQYLGSASSSGQIAKPGSAQTPSLGQIARNLRQKNQQPTPSFQQIVQDNQGKLEVCSASGTNCRVI